MAEDLTGVDKAAVLLLSLGPVVATEVFRHLDEGEVRQVTKALARIRSVPAEQLRAVEQDYRKRVGGTGGLRVDGLLFARELVNQTLVEGDKSGGASRDEILAELDQLPSGEAAGLARALEGVPPDGLARLLESEHPQIATLILAHLGPAQAMLVLRGLAESVQIDLVERLARLDSAIPPSLVAEVGVILRDQVKGLARETGKAAGGPKVVADMMKHADKTTEGRIFEDLEQRDPELAGSIRAMLFTFEDCLQFDNRSMQTLLKEVAREDLLLALKTASPALSEKIFANVSSRAAEILREDLSSSGPARLKDVEAAQQRIVAAVRDLEADGKLVVAGSGGGGDVLV
ncbi:MAG: flagellar motor switch protein FliG [Deltaproteobacteria bacterium]|nr:flagellar motor switch protein FliG [Deltaproteobacteria bacterium]